MGIVVRPRAGSNCSREEVLMKTAELSTAVETDVSHGGFCGIYSTRESGKGVKPSPRLERKRVVNFRTDLH